ncbi:unnamed protein product [Albugo candida]|uniref:Uncharacterized protein n=1 Tax=Albugo candida TaxID=65357 RepID=A0A024FVH9_9STRA|nr:unnamed protein product [Albugo candida]|eukprot:CCI11016.1 unnamed protein product [Albugo candida]
MLGPLTPRCACKFFYLMQQKNIISSELESKEHIHHCPWPKGTTVSQTEENNLKAPCRSASRLSHFCLPKEARLS